MALPLRPGRTIQKDLDIQEYTDPEHDPMIPHTLVLKPGLVVHRIYNGYWFWGRPSFYDLWSDLRTVSSEIRPDWDLSKPGCVRPGKPATTRTFTDGTSGPRVDSDVVPVIAECTSAWAGTRIQVRAGYRRCEPE